MVYMSGSKSARNAASICNRTNVCGGVKKAGTAPSVPSGHLPAFTYNRAPRSVPKLCDFIGTRNPTQRYAYLKGRL